MTYYPKNKILTNQVAAPDMVDKDGSIYNYVLVSNNQYYQGYFYALYNGKTYTGKYPGDGNNQEIIKLVDDIDKYDAIAPIPSLITSPIPPMFPTPKDYERGVFTRYFKKKRNELLYEELTKDQYDNNVNTTLYIKFQLQWQLTGDRDTTFNTNRNMVLLAQQNQNLIALGLYLKEDYLKYYQPTA